MLLDREGVFTPRAWWSGPWWSMLVKGIIAIVFGVVAVIWPGITLVTLVILFGIFFLVDGIFTIIMATQHHKVQKNWRWSLAAGVAGLVLGIIILSMPVISEIILIYLVGAWALIMGIMGTVSAVRMRKQISMGWPLTSGIIGIVFGILILAAPLFTALVSTEVIGFFAIFWGISLCYHSYHVHHQIKKPETPSGGEKKEKAGEK
ncbi:MAG: HdeD family acid-resistance protein [Dehalococcoidales bacterium]